jgi:hypothetical protein
VATCSLSPNELVYARLAFVSSRGPPGSPGARCTDCLSVCVEQMADFKSSLVRHERTAAACCGHILAAQQHNVQQQLTPNTQLEGVGEAKAAVWERIADLRSGDCGHSLKAPGRRNRSRLQAGRRENDRESGAVLPEVAAVSGAVVLCVLRACFCALVSWWLLLP